jgi:hypothetical protein
MSAKTDVEIAQEAVVAAETAEVAASEALLLLVNECAAESTDAALHAKLDQAIADLATAKQALKDAEA